MSIRLLTLRNKLLFFSILLALLPLGLAGRTMLRITEDELKSTANDEVSRTAGRLAQDIDHTYADTWLAPLQLVAAGLDTPSLGGEEKLSLLRSSIQSIADIAACQVSVLGVGGPILITRDEVSRRLAEAGLEAREVLETDQATLERLLARGTGGPVVGDLEQIEATGDWLATIVVPLAVPIAGRQAVLSARISLERLRHLVDEHPFGANGRLLVVDAEGRQVLGSEHTSLEGLDIVAEAVRLIDGPSRAIGVRPYTRPDGEAMLAGYALPESFRWAVIVERSEADAYLALDRMVASLRLMSLVGLGIAVAGGLFVSIRISRPVEEIARVAQEVGSGNLDVEVRRFRQRDELADLSVEMNEMIRGLRERDFIRETFGRYVSPQVAQTVLSDPAALALGGELRTVTILMSDLRGFTSLSEQMTPAEMVGLLNAYLGLMAEIIAESGGTVIEFLGDGIMAVFGAPIASDDHALDAAVCATRMQIALERFNGESSSRGLPPLSMGIGLNTGQVIVGNIGSSERMKYGMVGDDVNLTARVESFTVDGEVLLSRASRDALGDAARVRGPLEARAKGKREPLVMYALVALAAPHDLEVPAEHRAAPVLVDVRVQAECFRVDGKRVAAEPDRATVHRLGLADLELTLDSGPALAVFDSLKLRLHPPHGLGQAPVDELYAKVVAVEPGPEGTCYRLRLTSVPEAGRARLDSWLAST